MKLVQQQRQKINLFMTAELRQAISLLQYSTHDLYQFIQEQELENPLIELVQKQPDLPVMKNQVGITNQSNTKPSSLDFLSNKNESERDKLVEQLKWLDLNDKQKNILQYLILNLDSNGYLPLTEEEISHQLDLKSEETNLAIQLLQQLSPVGIGARNLKETLLLQLRHLYPEEKLTEKIIKDYLDVLADKKWHTISKELKVTLSEIKSSYNLIQTLNPRPCILDEQETEYLNPDIIINEIEGELEVFLNDSYLPKINFNNPYTDMQSSNNSLNNFISDKYKDYQVLVNSIEQRKVTILKITQAIIKKQTEFFTQGFSALKPLTLKEIADDVDMHESTISRATSNKSIQTPLGTFDFRIFFTSKLNTMDGNSASQTKVKLLLESFIKEEDKVKPFSDQKIADHFKKSKGINISRRTVTKYRDELNIPAASKRKEYII